MGAFYRVPAKAVATVLFIGYIPFAPGTFGSLAGMAVIWFLKPGIALQAGILAAGFAAGTASAHFAEKAFGEKDSSRIVIDEAVGYCVSVLALPQNAMYLIAAFLLFRFFDIVKPPPIKDIENRFGGGLGVMLDDVAAGIYTNVILQIAARL